MEKETVLDLFPLIINKDKIIKTVLYPELAKSYLRNVPLYNCIYTIKSVKMKHNYMGVRIDKKKCVCCGACEELTQKAIISPGDKPASLHPKADLSNPKIKESIRIAAETCPQKAIKIQP